MFLFEEDPPPYLRPSLSLHVIILPLARVFIAVHCAASAMRMQCKCNAHATQCVRMQCNAKETQLEEGGRRNPYRCWLCRHRIPIAFPVERRRKGGWKACPMHSYYIPIAFSMYPFCITLFFWRRSSAKGKVNEIALHSCCSCVVFLSYPYWRRMTGWVRNSHCTIIAFLSYPYWKMRKGGGHF